MIYRNTTLVIFTAFFLFFFSCNSEDNNLSPEEQTLIQAFQQSFDEHLEDAHPDSALALAKAVTKLHSTLPDQEQLFNAYYQVGDIFCHLEENDSAILYLNKGNEIAQQLNNKQLEAESMHMMGLVLISMQKYSEALPLLSQAMAVNLESGNINQLAANYSSVGLLFDDQYAYDSALVYYQKAASIFDSLNDVRNQAIVLANMAGIKTTTEDFDGSIALLRKTVPINVKINNLMELQSNYNRMGLNFMNLKSYDSASIYFRQSYEIADQIDDTFSKLIANFNTGRALSLSGKYAQANEIIRKVNDFCIENDIIDGQLRCLLRLGQNDLAAGKYPDAEKKLTQGLSLAVENEYPYFEREFLLEINRTILAQSLDPQSLAFFNRLLSVNDSIDLNKMKGKVLELETRYETSKKDHQLEILRKEQEMQRVRFRMLGVIASFIILLVALILILIRKRHQNLKHRHLLIIEQNEKQKISLEKNLLENEVKDTLIEIQKIKIRQKDQELVYSALNRAKSIEFFHHLKDLILPFQSKFKTRKDQQDYNKVIQEMEAANNLDAMSQFEKVFKELHPEFYENLTKKFPDLSSRELQLCALLRLNMNTKEIAAVTFLVSTSIDTARYRIRKKMNLDSDTSLINELLKY